MRGSRSDIRAECLGAKGLADLVMREPDGRDRTPIRRKHEASDESFYSDSRVLVLSMFLAAKRRT